MYKILTITPWGGSFPLNQFRLKMGKTDQSNPELANQGNLRVNFDSILTIFTWIGVILERIDNNLDNDIRHQQKLREALQGKRVKYTELPPSDINKTCIDVVSLILFLNILMDDVSRFLRFIFKGAQCPRTKGFHQLRKDLGKFQGTHVSELNGIIQSTTWYPNLKDLRDKNIVHKGEKSSMIGTNLDEIGIFIRYIENRKVHEEYFSNKKVDYYCQNVHSFLTNLNYFLVKYYDELPLEVAP